MTAPIDPADLVFGRIVQYDDRSKAYALSAAHYAANEVTPQPRTWRWDVPAPAPLDQGNTSECVAFAWAHELIAAPVHTKGVDGAAVHTWYRECKRIDGLGRGVQGTSVLAGAKTMKRHGYLAAYRWAMTEYDLAVGVSRIAPAVIGVEWRDGMMRPDRNGFIHPTGASLGGHCTLLVGLDVDGGFYWLLNSWGPGWGRDGLAKVSRVDMARLMRTQGEACIPTQVVPAGDTTATTGGTTNPVPVPKPTPPPNRPTTPPKPDEPRKPRPNRPKHRRGGGGDSTSSR